MILLRLIPSLLVAIVLCGHADVVLADAPAPAPANAASAAPAPKKTSGPIPIPPDINGFKTVIAPPARTAPVRVAIFNGDGAPMSGIENVKQVLATVPGATATLLKPEQIAAGGLSGFDVVVFSGGSASTQSKSLGDAGREEVRAFVSKGGGYVGICAGAYLACSGFSWGLGVLNASTVSSKWMRGRGFVDAEVTVDGAPILGEVKDVFKIRYNHGPVIKPGDRADLPAYRPVTLFRTEMADNGTPAGVMINTPALAVSTFGKGRVFISSPHPENTPGLEHVIPRAVLWAAEGLNETKKDLVP